MAPNMILEHWLGQILALILEKKNESTWEKKIIFIIFIITTLGNRTQDLSIASLTLCP